MQNLLRSLVLILCVAISYSLEAQTKPKPAPVKTVTPVLKNANDSASYAIGIFVINFYKSQGVTNINSAMVAKAINDLQSNQKALLNDEQANSAIINYLNSLSREKAKPNIEKGEKFLADNAKKPGIVRTASGLQYEVITQGTGPIPTVTYTVTVHYKGSFIDGMEFESSVRYGQPVSFTVGGVIKGWTEALQMMPVGSKWKLYIPYQLAYGVHGNQGIPPGSVLIFEIDLLGIKGK